MYSELNKDNTLWKNDQYGANFNMVLIKMINAHLSFDSYIQE